MFLNFANFYQRFVEFYAKIARSFIEFLKNNNNNKQNNLFLYNNVVRIMFQILIEIFIRIFMFVHFNFKNKIKIKTNIFDFIIIAILF